MEVNVDNTAVEVDVENGDSCYMIVVVGEDGQVDSEILTSNSVSDLRSSSPNDNSLYDQIKPNTLVERQDYRSSRMEISSLVPLLIRIEDDEELCKWIANSKSTNSNITGTIGSSNCRLKQTGNGSHPDKRDHNVDPENYEGECVLTRNKTKVESERRKRKGCTRISNNNGKRITLDSNDARTSEATGNLVGTNQFTCTVCGYSSRSKCGSVVHVLLHHSSFTCSMGSYVTKSLPCLNRNGETNKDENRAPSSQAINSADHKNKRPFKCLECPWTGELLAHLNSHMFKHFKDKKSRSPSEIVNSKSHRTSHTITNFKATKSVSVGLKATGKSQPNRLSTNLKRNESRPIVSDLKDNDRENLRVHKLTGSRKSTVNMYECLSCTFKTCFEMQIQSHMETHKRKPADHLNPPKNRYLCELCPYRCASEEQLNTHTKSHSKENDHLICEQCGYQFDQKAHLLEHKCVLESDLDEPESQEPVDLDPNLSSEVGKIWLKVDEEIIRKTNKKDARKEGNHLKRRTETVTCEICSKIFANRYLLAQHSMTHRSAQDRPYKCSECSWRGNLPVQLRNHSLVHNGEKKFKCPLCDYRAVTKKYVKVHILGKHGNEKPYLCALCPYRCVFNYQLVKHYRVHTGEKKFSCDKCGKRFIQKVHLANHRCKSANQSSLFSLIQEIRSSQPNEESSLKGLRNVERISKAEDNKHSLASNANGFSKLCDTCGKVFADHYRMRQHLMTHQEQRPLKCSECSWTGFKPCHLKTHMLIHSKERNFICSLCDYRAKTKQNLRAHLITHGHEKPFSCDQCPYRTAFRSSLVKHQMVHTGLKPFSCSQCGKRFSQKQHMVRHRCKRQSPVIRLGENINDEEIVEDEKNTGQNAPEMCEASDYASQENSNIVEPLDRAASVDELSSNEWPTFEVVEISTHSVALDSRMPKRKINDRIYMCESCGKSFSTKSDLSNHKVVHSEDRPFKCIKCPRSFKRKKDLKLHIEIHSDTKRYGCPICDYKAKTERLVMSHLRTHSDNKPFSCEFCSFSCRFKQQLKTHVLTHMEDKPFKCDQCPKTFHQKMHWTRHLQRHREGKFDKKNKQKQNGVDNNIVTPPSELPDGDDSRLNAIGNSIVIIIPAGLKEGFNGLLSFPQG